MLDNYSKEYHIQQLYSVRSLKRTPNENNVQNQNYFVSNILSPTKTFSNQSGKNFVIPKMHRSQNTSKQNLPEIGSQHNRKTTAQPNQLYSPKQQYKIQFEPLQGEEPITIPYLRLNFRLKHGYKKQKPQPERSSVEVDELKLKNKRSLSLFREKHRDLVNKVSQQVHEILLKENKQLCVGFEKLELELMAK